MRFTLENRMSQRILRPFEKCRERSPAPPFSKFSAKRISGRFFSFPGLALRRNGSIYRAGARPRFAHSPRGAEELPINSSIEKFLSEFPAQRVIGDALGAPSIPDGFGVPPPVQTLPVPHKRFAGAGCPKLIATPCIRPSKVCLRLSLITISPNSRSGSKASS